MNQRLSPSSRRSRRSVYLPHSPWHCAGPCRFALQVRLRGQLDPACEVPCAGLEEAIHFGESEFPAFVERNPWIGLAPAQDLDAARSRN